MIDFGETLRRAREAKGMTVMQIAEATCMLPQQIEDLENENFTRIAAPIYGRGFVKLYCGVVGLDPKPLVAEFMDIFNGNKQPTIKMRKSVRQAVPAPKPQEQEAASQKIAMQPAAVQNEAQPPVDNPRSEEKIVAETPPQPPPPPSPPEEAADDSGIIRAASEPLFDFVQPAPAPQPEENKAQPSIEQASVSAAAEMKRAVESQPFQLEQETVQVRKPLGAFAENGKSRFSTPQPIDIGAKYSDFHVPPVFWRMCILAGVVALVAWLLFALGAKVWRAATTVPSEPTAAEIEAAEAAQARDAKKANENGVSVAPAGDNAPKNRTPIKLPPLYIE